MKKIMHFLAAIVAMTALSVACTELEQNPEKPVEPVVPDAEIEAVSGIEKVYELGLHEVLAITPVVQMTEGDQSKITYEWNINHEKVSEELSLSYKCSTLGSFDGFFKVKSENGEALISEFKFNVTSPYDRGLLLLSETEKDGAMLTFKRLDIMSGHACPMAFRDNNPGLELGKKALDIAWMGNSLTGKPDMENDLNVFISTGDPVKVYSLDPKTLKSKREIIFNGAGEFVPNKILIPFGFQNQLWDGIVYFMGGGREQILSPEYTFIEASETGQLPDPSAPLADVAFSHHAAEGDMPRIYFNTANNRLVMNGGTAFSVESANVYDVTPMYMLPCKAEYRIQRYEPYGLALVGNKGDNVTVYIVTIDIDWDTFELADVIDATIDASGKILPTSAVCTDPIKPIMYYSNANGIYRLNIDGQAFDAAPYITLPEGFEAKAITFNQFDQNTMYIAAENTK